jgi:hypothetical protein
MYYILVQTKRNNGPMSFGSGCTKHLVKQLTRSDDFPSFISMILVMIGWSGFIVKSEMVHNNHYI